MNLNKKAIDVYSHIMKGEASKKEEKKQENKNNEETNFLKTNFQEKSSESLKKTPETFQAKKNDKDKISTDQVQLKNNYSEENQDNKLIKTASNHEPSLRRVAKFLLLIGIDEAAKIMARLSPEQAEKIAFELSTIRRVDKDEATVILAEFNALAQQAQYPKSSAFGEGGVETANSILEAAFGAEKAKQILERSVPDLNGKPFDYLTELDSERLQILLKDESVAVYTLVLTQIPPQLAASVIKTMEPEKQSQVIKRLAKINKIDPQVLRQIDKTLREKIKNIDTSSRESIDGRSALSQILRQMDPSSEQKILNSISQKDPDLGHDMKDRMFTIDDLANANTRWLQEELRKMTNGDIALLVWNKSEELRNSIFTAVSKSRGAQILEEESLLTSSDASPTVVAENKSLARQITKHFLQLAKNAWLAGDLIIKERDIYV